MKNNEKTTAQLLKELQELQKNYNSLKEIYESNISERKLNEEELKENKEKYRGLSEAAFESIFISEKGLCIEQNQTAEKIFGYTNEEATQSGRYGTEWIAVKDRDMVMQNMLAGFEEPYEVTALRKDGTTFPCMLRGKMMHYKGRTVRVTSLSDITERKRVEAELIISKERAEESERLKSAFLANMSHEIRTPMNGILGFAGLLKVSKLTGEQQQQYISIIEKSGARMLNIINDIVDISKIESGLMEVDIKESNINEQMEFIFNFFKPEVENKGMKFNVVNNLPKKEAIILIDQEKLYAILINLVKNAIKYSDKGSIEFGYKLKKNNKNKELSEQHILEFYVKDTGIGIAKERQDAVFERFIQADISDSRAYQGAGLGLSISKAYVEMLGGKIWVESELGKGSVFYFNIPYNIGLEENLEKNILPNYNEEENNIRNLKILIVEDDNISEKFISTVVKVYSKEILIARNGIKAVELCRNNSDIDFVLMDIKMAEMNGYEATKQIRKFNKKVIIIAQTAHGLLIDKKRAIDAGCNDYISKPINVYLLKGLIKKYFNKSNH